MARLGFHLSANTSVLFEDNEKKWCESNSELLSKCYPNFAVRPPLSIKALIGQKFSDVKLHSSDYLIGTDLIEGFDGFPIFLGSNDVPVTIPQLLTNFVDLLTENSRSRDEQGNVENMYMYVGIPIYFTYLQRRIMLDAVKAAEIYEVKFLHETTASVLNIQYSFLGENKELYVAFVDMGVNSMQATVVRYVGSDPHILSHAFDCSLGGRAFDAMLLNHFVVKYRDEHDIDATNHIDLYWKLYSVCEKMKIELSSLEDASFELSWGDKVLIGSIKREEFERMCAPLLERILGPLERALDYAGLSVEKIHSIQCVGLASQIPDIIKKFTDFSGRKPIQIKEGSQMSIARVCQSLNYLPDKYALPYSILMSWDKSEVTIEGDAVISPKWSPVVAGTKYFTFSGSATFYIDFISDNVEYQRTPTKMARFKISPAVYCRTTEKVQGKFNVELTQCGIVEINYFYVTAKTEKGEDISFEVQEEAAEPIPYSIEMSWDKNKVTIEGGVVLFPKGSMELTKCITFSGFARFYIDFMHDNMGDLRIPPRIVRLKIEPVYSSFATTKVQGTLEVTLKYGIVETKGLIESKMQNGKKIELLVSHITGLEESFEEPNEHEQHLPTSGKLQAEKKKNAKLQQELTKYQRGFERLHEEKINNTQLQHELTECQRELAEYQRAFEKIIEMYSKPEFYDCDDDGESQPTDGSA